MKANVKDDVSSLLLFVNFNNIEVNNFKLTYIHTYM